jgi:E3 ubiquitin-protein ligase HUWE1
MQRLAALLFTSDLQVLCATLEVLLKPSQQYSVHTQFELSRGEGGKYPEVHKRLLGLASGWGTWGSLKEKGRDMVALASSDPNEVATASSAFAQATSQDLQISFYRTADSAPTPQVQASVLEQPTADLQLKESTGFAAESTPIDSPSKPSTSRSSALQYSFGLGDGTPSAARATSTGESSTPRPARPVRMESDVGAESETTSGIRASTNSDGYTTITLSSQYIRSAVERGLNANQVLATLVKQYHPPKNVWYTFLGKLRSVMILSGTDAALQELRRDMIVSRMLALATYGKPCGHPLTLAEILTARPSHLQPFSLPKT